MRRRPYVSGLFALSAWVVLLGLFPSAGGKEAAGPKTATRPARFTVATYNINFANPNLKEVVAAITRSEADFVCLQETNRRSERFLRSRLGRTYRYMIFRHARGAGGLGFLSKSRIRHVSYLRPRFGWFGTWIVKVRLGGVDVQVAGVHLQPTDVRRASSLAELGGLFSKAEAVRLAEIRRIHAALKKQTPTIVLGDLNTFSYMDAPRFLTERGFTDSFAAVTKDPDAHATWRWVARGVEWKYRIDYIFHSAGIRTHSSQVIESGGSDHYLLVSALGWAPKQGGSAGQSGPRGEGSQAPASRPAGAGGSR